MQIRLPDFVSEIRMVSLSRWGNHMESNEEPDKRPK